MLLCGLHSVGTEEHYPDPTKGYPVAEVLCKPHLGLHLVSASLAELQPDKHDLSK